MRYRSRKFGSQKGVFRLPFRHHSHQEKKEKMRDEKEEKGKVIKKKVNSL